MKIYIIGAGNMGGAIAAVLANRHRIFIYDRKPKKIKETIFDANLKNSSKADFLVLAVKPQDIPPLAKQLELNPKTVLISIAAGVKIQKLQKLFHHNKIVRAMPNLGLSVGQGIAGWKAAGLSAQEKSRAKALLNQICENFEVRKESDIDSITAISGSGPAYFFYLAEALQKSAKALGFGSETSRKLVEKTFAAAAALQKNGNYDELIKQIASKKGTTEAALKVFSKHGLGRTIKQAAQAAKKRAEEMSRE